MVVLGFGARGLAFFEVGERSVYFVVILVWRVLDFGGEGGDSRTVVGRALRRRVDCSSHD